MGDEDAVDEAVADAVTRLLRATMEFTRAYEAWAHDGTVADRRALDDAERRLTLAEREVVRAQLRRSSPPARAPPSPR